MFPKQVSIKIGGDEAVVIEIKHDPITIGCGCCGCHAPGDVIKFRYLWDTSNSLPYQFAGAAIMAKHFHFVANVARHEEFVPPNDRR